MASIFLSYRHVEPDRTLARFLYRCLADADHEVFIDEADIPLGAYWGKEIKENLHRAEWFLPLISSAYLYSQYIQENEIEPAARFFHDGRLMGILPVNLAYDGDPPVALRSIASDLQFVKWRSQADDMTVAQAIMSRLPRPVTLVKGMRAFGASEADRFPELERTKDIQAFLRLLDTDIKPILLHGQSGCGKSSFLQAGIIPRLQGRRVDYYSGKVTTQQFASWAAVPGAAVIFIDQFEQTLTSYAQAGNEVSAFWESQLAQLSSSESEKQVVFSLRDEYRSTFDAIVCSPSACRTFALRTFAPDVAAQVFSTLLQDARVDFDADFLPGFCREVSEDIPPGVRPAILQLIAQHCKHSGASFTRAAWTGFSTDSQLLFERHIKDNLLSMLPKSVRTEQATAALVALTAGLTKTRPRTSADIVKEARIHQETVVSVMEMASLPHVRVVTEFRDQPEAPPEYQLTHDLFAQAIRKLDVQARQHRDSIKRIIWTVVGITAALAIIVLLMGYFSFRRQAIAQENLKEALRLDNLSRTVSSHDPVLALNLALASIGTDALSPARKDAYELFAENTMYRVVKRFPESEEVTDLAAFADHSGFLASTESGVYLLSRSGQVLKNFPPTSQPVTSVAINKDESRVVTVNANTVTMWTRSGIALWSHQETGDMAFGADISGTAYSWDTDAAFAPDETGEVLVAPGNLARLYSADGNRVRDFVGHQSKVFAVAFSPDGSKIVTGSHDHTARLWSRGGALLQVFRGHTAPIANVLFDAASGRVITGSFDFTTRVWDAATGKCLYVLQDGRSLVTALAQSADRDYYVSGYADGSVDVWQRNGNLLLRLRGHQNEVTSIKILDDGNTIVTASHDGTIRSWDVRTAVPETVISANHQDVSAVSWSPDGHIIAAALRDGTVAWWDTHGAPILSIQADSKAARVATFSSNGRYLLTAGEDDVGAVWTLDGNKVVQLVGHEAAVATGSFVPDKEEVLTGGYDGLAIRWDLQGSQLKRYKGHTAQIYALDVSPDGKFLLTGSKDRTAKLWDIASGAQIQSFQHPSPVRSVHFLPNGFGFVSGDYNGIVRVWQFNSSKSTEMMYHRAVVRGLAAPVNEAVFASSSEDNRAVVWSISGLPLQVFSGLSDHATSLAFSPKGDQLVVGSKDKFIYLYSRQEPLATFLENGKLEELTDDQRKNFGIMGRFSALSNVTQILADPISK